MNTMSPPKGTDLAAWRDDRVPPDVKQAIIFIYINQKARTPATWASIAQFMGWDVPRPEIRAKMKRLRRWGVRWNLNESASTRVDRKVHPYLDAEIEKLRKTR